jgi:hypothetical protein
LKAWIQQAADNMKAVDPNHMVTIGEEGFYGFGAPAASIATNPNSDSTGSAHFTLLSSHPIIPLGTSSSLPRLLPGMLIEHEIGHDVWPL